MLILVRHGRTAANAAGRLQGRLDLPLDELGRSQAAAVAKWVGPVDRVISSPLQRARQTAEAFGMPYEIDDRWIELDYGVFDNTPISEMPHEIYETWRENPAYVPPGGESLTDLGVRVRKACDELVTDAAERDVVVVTHVSPMKAAVAWTLDVGLEIAWHCMLAHGSVCRISFEVTGPVLQSFNELPARVPSGL